jgi:ribosomal protein S18 acetylase RimI-like enzyme
VSELRWLTTPTEDERASLHRLVAAVAGAGGAVGWLSVPSRAEVDAWFDGLPAGARLVVAVEGGEVLAAGYWARLPAAVLQHDAEIRKVMVHPDARGRGLGRSVTRALVEDCRAAGVEAVSLDCRGNNHGALAMYASLGFVVSGRRPDWIAVGDERFDQVLLHLDLRDGSEPLVRHGGRREGPGSS